MYANLKEPPSYGSHKWSTYGNETIYILSDELKDNGGVIWISVGFEDVIICRATKGCKVAQDEINQTLAYTIQKLDVNCQFWNASDEYWSSNKCEVLRWIQLGVGFSQLASLFQVETADPARIRMKSNLFGSFGAGLFTGPNMIDFGTVFDNFGAKLLENIHVFATMIIIIAAYIPFAVFCRKLDKKDTLKVCFKEFNVSQSQLVYLIIIVALSAFGGQFGG
jgi:hypothetical protein